MKKINAITAETLGIIRSKRNVLKLIYTDNERKSKIEINNIINAEYIRIDVVITFTIITDIFRNILFIFLINKGHILTFSLRIHKDITILLLLI